MYAKGYNMKWVKQNNFTENIINWHLKVDTFAEVGILAKWLLVLSVIDKEWMKQFYALQRKIDLSIS